MVLPIIAYGDPVLRKVATDISPDYPNLNTLIANMYDTMNYAYGVGLAAPQIGLPIRLFVVDTAPLLMMTTSLKRNVHSYQTSKKLLSTLKSPKKQVINGSSTKAALVYLVCAKTSAAKSKSLLSFSMSNSPLSDSPSLA